MNRTRPFIPTHQYPTRHCRLLHRSIEVSGFCWTVMLLLSSWRWTLLIVIPGLLLSLAADHAAHYDPDEFNDADKRAAVKQRVWDRTHNPYLFDNDATGPCPPYIPNPNARTTRRIWGALATAADAVALVVFVASLFVWRFAGLGDTAPAIGGTLVVSLGVLPAISYLWAATHKRGLAEPDRAPADTAVVEHPSTTDGAPAAPDADTPEPVNPT